MRLDPVPSTLVLDTAGFEQVDQIFEPVNLWSPEDLQICHGIGRLDYTQDDRIRSAVVCLAAGWEVVRHAMLLVSRRKLSTARKLESLR
ncbi:MAG TPA: hypothetical protein DEV93_05345 [Chloroflexi bacterium]|nr:hypothetical protein [Chloroflexota bacterium]